jgi:hypothetical protein
MRGSFAANQIDHDIPNRQLVANSAMMAGNFRLTERVQPCSPDFLNAKIAAASTVTVRVPEALRRSTSCRCFFFVRCDAAIVPAGHFRASLCRCKSASNRAGRLNRDELQLPDG